MWALLTPSSLWSAETKRERAARYYRQASQLLKDFRRVPEPELGAQQYLLVAKAFRKVYLTSPASGYCDDSLLVEAEMYRKAAARFESEKRRADALKTYRFLAREYPHSKLKPQALAAIAEIEGRAAPELARNAPPVAPAERPPVADPVPKKVADLRSAATGETTAPAPIPVRRQPRRPGRGGPRSVSAVRFWSHADSTRIVVDIDDVTRYRFERLSKPNRLFVDLSNARLGPKFSKRRITTLAVNDDRIRQIRVAQNRPTTVRVVFDLEQAVRPDFQWLANPERLAIDLRSAAQPPLFAAERPRGKAEAPGRNAGVPPDPAPLEPAAALSQVSDSPLGGESDVATPDSDTPTSPSTSSDAAEPLLAVTPGNRPSAASEGFSSPPPAPLERFVFEAAPPSVSDPDHALPSAAPPLVAAAPNVVPAARLILAALRSPSFELPAPPIERFEFTAPPPSVPARHRALPAARSPAVAGKADMEAARSFLALARAATKRLKALPPLEQPKPPVPAAAPEPETIAKLEPPEPAPTLELAEPPKAARATSRGKRNLIRALGLKVGRVVIDAGHGGHDTGSIGTGGLREKDLVVDISRRLGELIETNLGADVIYTRTTDRSVSLKERTKLANDSEADLFISVHANSSRLRSIRGVETYYLSFTTNSWALGVASRENAAARRSIHELEDLLLKIALTERIEESREFAGKVQESLYGGLAKQTKGLRNRGVRKAPFMVLVGAKMPAVLAEVGFLSNPQDEKLLKSSSYRQKIANHLFEGVRGYSDTLSKVTLTESAAATSDGVD